MNQVSIAPIHNANDLIAKIVGIGNVAIYLLVSLALIFIIWNIVFYFIRSADEGGRGKAGMNILWGIVGLFLIVSIWGLVNILVNTFHTDSNRPAAPNADFLNKQNPQLFSVPSGFGEDVSNMASP